MFNSARRVLLPVFALVSLLAGCATSTMSLTQDELRSIKIERVNVVYNSDAFISWEKQELPYVERVKAAKSANPGKPKPWKQVMKEDEEAAKNEYHTILNSPEGKQHMQNVLAAEIKRRVGAEILPKYQGTRRVYIEVTVYNFSIPGPAQRILVGGTPMLLAVTTIKDSVTGKELAKLDQGAAGHAGNGAIGVLVDQAFEDMEDRVFASYLQNVSRWLQSTRGS